MMRTPRRPGAATVAAAFIALLACDPPPERANGGPPSVPDSGAPRDSLATVVLNDDDAILLPSHLVLAGRHLIVLDPYRPGLHVLDVITGTRVRSFGREGDGPNELMHPAAAAVVDSGSRLLLGDPGAGRVLLLSVDSLVAEGSVGPVIWALHHGLLVAEPMTLITAGSLPCSCLPHQDATLVD